MAEEVIKIEQLKHFKDKYDEQVGGQLAQVNTQLDTKLDKTNPTGTGAFSLNRKANTTIGSYSFAEGYNTTASGTNGSHAEGINTKAISDSSHAEGDNTTASGSRSHAEGVNTTASGFYSHAEGYGTTARGQSSHAEGEVTTASRNYSHAEGYGTIASGSRSHAEGGTTTASGDYSHAEGLQTTAQRKSQHVFGEYNVLDTTGSEATRGSYIEIVGNGSSTSARSNARTLDWSGNEKLQGTVYVNCNSDSTGGSQVVSQADIEGTGAKLYYTWDADTGTLDFYTTKPGENN